MKRKPEITITVQLKQQPVTPCNKYLCAYACLYAQQPTWYLYCVSEGCMLAYFIEKTTFLWCSMTFDMLNSDNWTDPSPFKTSGSTLLESIQEDQPQCGAVNEEMQEDLPSLSLQGPTPSKKKKKKTGFNLRKSLAWNNAFFTEEGKWPNPLYSLPLTFLSC